MAEQDELAQLEQMHAQGMLTDAELELARSQALSRAGDTDEPPGAADEPPGAADEPPGAADESNQPVPADVPAEPAPAEVVPPEPIPARRPPFPWVAVLFGVLALAGVALVIVALVGGGSSSGGSHITVNGIVVITEHTSVYPDDPTVQNGQQFGTGGYNVGKGCHALTGYQDIATGANVVITGSGGTQLAATKLRAGVFDTNADCVFGFTATINKSSSYEIKIGQRDPVQYPAGSIASPQLVL